MYKVLLDGIQPLAAKELRLTADGLEREEFMREAATLWRLRHPHIVTLVGVAWGEGGRGFLLMVGLLMGAFLVLHCIL